ncbi:hypothetical protein MTR_7g101385 [Medicago truncatula]|uniref:Uncharacterized protein n=1 Tax=Medicago truncatula TaxID=3880 RepID=A0A072U2S4_MEDTR|nr:hypothetical protein MTR_7g101385 [Medicago truncatula]
MAFIGPFVMVELVVEELVGHTAVVGKMIVCDLCTCPTVKEAPCATRNLMREWMMLIYAARDKMRSH